MPKKNQITIAPKSAKKNKAPRKRNKTPQIMRAERPAKAEREYRPSSRSPVCFSHSEYCSEIYVPEEFTTSTGIVSARINPGLTTLMDFLSQVGANYTEYRFKKLSFKWMPAVGNTTTTGQMGFVSMCFQYNASAPNFESFPEMQDYEGCITKKICDGFTIEVDCRKQTRNLEWYMVRAGAPDSNANIYDFGKISLAVSGIAPVYLPNTLLGRVTCSYTVEFDKPRLYSALGYSIDFCSATTYYPEGSWGTTFLWGDPGNLLFDPRGTIPFYLVNDATGPSGNKNTIVFDADLQGKRVCLQYLVQSTSGTSNVNGFSVSTTGFAKNEDNIIWSSGLSQPIVSNGLFVQGNGTGAFNLDLVGYSPPPNVKQVHAITLRCSSTSTGFKTLWYRLMIMPRTSRGLEHIPYIQPKADDMVPIVDEPYETGIPEVIVEEDTRSVSSISSYGRPKR